LVLEHLVLLNVVQLLALGAGPFEQLGIDEATGVAEGTWTYGATTPLGRVGCATGKALELDLFECVLLGDTKKNVSWDKGASYLDLEIVVDCAQLVWPYFLQYDKGLGYFLIDRLNENRKRMRKIIMIKKKGGFSSFLTLASLAMVWQASLLTSSSLVHLSMTPCISVQQSDIWARVD